MMRETDELLSFLKALGDANRLKIVSLLSKKPHTVEQLAALLGLGASTVSHHLSRLSEAGLVTATAQSYYNFYRLEPGRIETMAGKLLSLDTLILPQAETAPEDVAAAYERKVVSDYLLPDGRLKTIPAQRKKLQAVLRHIVNAFAPERSYTEKEVNQVLARFHADTASLRRELIGAGLMERESSGQAYWRSKVS